MKTILTGTDFTPSSLNACLYGAMLAKKLDCKLTLFNLFEVPAIHSNSGLYFISYEASRENSEEKMARAIKDIKLHYPKLHIEFLLTTGSFKSEIEHFIKHHQVEMVVLGLAAKTKLSKFIYGSHSTDIAGKINAPVVIVPEQYKTHKFKSFLLGVDHHEKLKPSSLSHFQSLIKNAKAALKVLHVRTKGEIFAPEKMELKLADKVYKPDTFFAKDLEDGLNKFARKSDSDLIVIVSRHHSPIYNFFAESNTKKIAFVSRIPVMAIHE